MDELQKLLKHLSKILPPASLVDTDSLYEIADAINEALHYEGRLASYSSVLDDLDPAHRKLYEGLVHLECLWSLFNDLANDGLLSVFYNYNKHTIDQMHQTLKAHNDPVSQEFERAYRFVAPTFVSEGEENWVTQRDPYEAIGESAGEEIKAIEHALEELRSSTWARCVAIYRAARNTA